MDNGWHENVADWAYHELPHLSSHKLFDFLKSPYYYYERHVKRNRPIEKRESRELEIGRALHSLVLEPHRDGITIEPNVDRRTKAGKEAYNDFRSRSKPHSIVLNNEEYEKVEKMKEALLRHPEASELLFGPGMKNELTGITEYEGAKIRIRPDRINDVLMVDLKTTKDARPDEFLRSCQNYGYFNQDAFYTIFSKRIDGKTRRMKFVVVEKEEPFEIGIYEFNNDDRMRIIENTVDHLLRFLECLKKNNWPRMCETVKTLDLKPWHF